MVPRSALLACAAAGLLQLGCPPDNPDGDDTTGGSDASGSDSSTTMAGSGGGTGDTGGTTTADDPGPWPTDGMIGCAAGASCTFVFASQALDDRVDIYAAEGGDSYRGSIDVDFKPNPGGDNVGGNLDEPYGMAFAAEALHLTVGHYPARDNGSLVSFPLEFLAAYDVGVTIPQADFFDAAGDTYSGGVSGVVLDEEEAIFALRHRSERVLIGVFNNDLFVPPEMWDGPGKLLVFDPPTGDVGTFELTGCAGAWNLVPLGGDKVALACDGSEGVAIVDVSGVGDGSAADAAGSLTRCVGQLAFPDKRTRALAADGLGGVIVTDVPQLSDASVGRMWRFDGDCEGVGTFGELEAGTIWDVRSMVLLDASGPYWLLANGKDPSGARGVHIVDGSGDRPELCGRLDDLDGQWSTDGGDIDPHALALTSDGTGLAVGAGPDSPAAAAAGYGKVLWAKLDVGDDPCTTTASVTDLTHPAVIADEPATWHRAPDVVVLREVEG